jgi:outer membrane protein
MFMGLNIMNRAVGVFSFAVFMLLANPVMAQPIPVKKAVEAKQNEQVTLDVLNVIYQQHPDLKAARARFKADYERIIQAYGGTRPNINLNANIQSVETEGNFFGPTRTNPTEKNWGAQIKQPLFRGFSTYADIQSAQHFVLGQFYQLQSIEQNILQQAITQIYETVTSGYLVQANQQNLALLEEQDRVTKARFDVGEISRTDTAQATAALESARADLQNAISQQEIAIAHLKQMIGDDTKAAALIPLVQKMDLDRLQAFLLPMPEGLESLIQAADDQNPAILSSRAYVQAAKYDTRKIIGSLLPQLDLVASWNKTLDPAPGLIDQTTNKIVGVTATMPLYDGGNTYSRLRQAHEETQARHYDVQATQNLIHRQVETAWSAWKAAHAQLLSRKSQSDAALIAQQSITEEQKNGLRSTLDVLQVTQNSINAKTAYLTARKDELVSFYQLMNQSGLLTQGKLSSLQSQAEDYMWSKIGHILGVKL